MANLPSGNKKFRLSGDEVLESIITEGQVVPGDSGIFQDLKEIPWLDIDLTRSGQEFFARNYCALVFAHGIYFGLGFGFKPVTSTIIRTRGFHGVERTTKRLLSILHHLLRWYESDIAHSYSEGFKAIVRVRKTHALYRKRFMLSRQKGGSFYLDEEEESFDNPILTALKKDLQFLDRSTFEQMNLTYNTPEPMSQFSLAVTQLGFLLPVFANPEAFGLEGLEGADGFEHLWAVIGQLSGLEDRFNLPLHRPGREAYLRIWREIYLPSFLVRDSRIVEIQNSFYYDSANTYALMPTLGPASSLYFFMKQSYLDGFDGTELYKIIPYRERVGVLLMRLIFWLTTVSIFFRKLANLVTRNMIQKVLNEYNPHGKRIEKSLLTRGRQA